MSTNGDVEKAAEAAKRGCDSTEGMKASLGRAVYVGGDLKCPDPGAVGGVAFVQGLLKELHG